MPNHNRLNAGLRKCRCWLIALVFLTGPVAAIRVAAAACSSAPVGLVGWWAGDGNANDIAGTNNGTLQGGATATGVGEVGQAFSFDGATGYVQIPDAPALKPTNLTVEAWVRFSSLDSTGSGGSPAGDQYIVFKQNSRSSNFEGYFLGKTRISGQDHFTFQVTSVDGTDVELDSVSLVSTGVWYHVAAVRGSNYVQLYVNGNRESTNTVSFPQDYGTLPLYFGTSGQSYWDHKFSGLLDEVSLYNRALSSNEVAAIYYGRRRWQVQSGDWPNLTTQPQSQTVAATSNALFTVAATGTAPLYYQWRFNGTNMPGATNNTSLTLTTSNRPMPAATPSW